MSLEALLRSTFDDRADQAPPDSAVDGSRIRRRVVQVRRRRQLSGVWVVAVVFVAAAVLVPRLPRLPLSDGSAVAPLSSPTVAAANVLGTGECRGIRVALHLEADPRTIWPVSQTGTTITIPGNTLMRIVASGPCLDRVSFTTDGTMIQGPEGGGRTALSSDGAGFVVAHSVVGGTTTIDFEVRVGAADTALAVVTVHVEPGKGLETTTPPVATR